MSIIVNGGFESGTLSPGWQQTPGSAVLDGGVTNATSCSGDYCLELKSMDFVEQVLFLKKGTSELSFQTKVETLISAGPCYLTVVYADGTETTNGPLPSSIKWQKVSYPVDPCKCISKIRFGTGETVSRYIDDVYLEGEFCLSAVRRDMPDWMRDYFLSRMMEWGSLDGSFSLRGNKEYIMALEDRLVYLENQMASLLSKQRKTKKRPRKDDKSERGGT